MEIPGTERGLLDLERTRQLAETILLRCEAAAEQESAKALAGEDCDWIRFRRILKVLGDLVRVDRAVRFGLVMPEPAAEQASDLLERLAESPSNGAG